MFISKNKNNTGYDGIIRTDTPFHHKQLENRIKYTRQLLSDMGNKQCRTAVLERNNEISPAVTLDFCSGRKSNPKHSATLSLS